MLVTRIFRLVAVCAACAMTTPRSSMGTVIDPDMGDDLRVTVVATGLGEPVRSSLTREKPVRLEIIDNAGHFDADQRYTVLVPLIEEWIEANE